MKTLIASGSNQLSLDTSHANPIPGEGEVLVKVAAAPLQPSDRLNVKGDFPATKFPIIPERNYAGTVVGPESSKWLGKRVYGTSGHELSFTRNGTYAEFVTVPEYGLTEIPDNMNWVQAALVGLPWITAWLTLNRAGAKKGDTVAVLGAGGNVGSAVVEMARSSFFQCNVFRAGRGSKYDIDMKSDPGLNGLKEKTGGGNGPDVVIDTTGELLVLAAAIKALGKKGRLAFISTGSSHGSTTTELNVDFKDLYKFEQSIVGCNSVDHDMAETAAWMKVLSKGFESGELTPPSSDDPRVKTVGLDDAIDAYQQLDEGLNKLVVIVADV